ncbi:MAG: cytochrome P450 [Gammaproteobacteria bacterium]|nr:cytochrome P450 [Gammaproteobacteria bacterium]
MIHSDSTPAAPVQPLLPPAVPEAFDINLTAQVIERLALHARTLPDIFRVHSPQRDRDDFVVIRPDLVKRVLLDNRHGYGKGAAFSRVKLLLGNSIIASDGDVWHRNRLMIQPAFHKQAVEDHARRLIDLNREVAQRWADQADAGHPIDVTAATSELALHDVLLALFSEDLRRFEDDKGHNPLWMVNEHSERNLRFALEFRQLATPVRELLRWRRQHGVQRDDIVGIIMRSTDRQTGQPMAERQLVDEILMLIVAGHETTASALNFCWYLLSRHPKVQADLHAEVERVIGDRDPTIEDLGRLQYCRQVLEESMRLYPPGWAFSRKALADDSLGGYHVPKGTELLVTPYLTHRHPGWWREPERFDPTRFEPGARAARDRFAFLPFSAGPRRCIGDGLAMLEMQLHLAMVVPRVGFRAPADRASIEVEAEINLRSRQPIVLSAFRRP